MIGVWVGLAGLSKYSAVLTIAGLFVFVATSRMHRRWLAHPASYAGAALALALLAPVFVWNARNGWVSFAFQTERGLPADHIKISRFITMVGGQIALLSPWVVLPLAPALAAALRSIRSDSRSAFLLSVSLPAIVVFTLVPLWGAQGMPHWTMPGWFFAFPLLGAWLSKGGLPWLRPRIWCVASGAAFSIVIGVGVSHASSGWIRHAWPTLFAAGDPTLESFSWTQLRTAPAFAAQRPDFVVASRWTDGAKLAAAFDGTIPVVVFSDDPRQFAFSHDVGAFLHKNALIVLSPAQAARKGPALARYFSHVEMPQTVWLGRRGLEEVPLVVERAVDLIESYRTPYPARTLGPPASTFGVHR
jgi:hypothetical protein